jgi:hypothetical protein
MGTVLIMLVSAALVLAPMYIVPAFIQSPVILQQEKSAYAQVASQGNNTASNASGLLSSIHPYRET